MSELGGASRGDGNPELFQRAAIEAVPDGAWAVGVSGGADSVALLAMLRADSRLRLHVVHIDHQTRGADSAADAEFVADLARQWGLPEHIFLRSQIENQMRELPSNRSARFRAVRMQAFARVVAEHHLDGVLMAHHADDLAETVLHRLLRGSGARGLAVMPFVSFVNELKILRPLLSFRRGELRAYLHQIGQSWREDASNQSDAYSRNRLRKLLSANEQLTSDLLTLVKAAHRLRRWLDNHSLQPEEVLRVSQLQSFPHVLAAELARKWLAMQGILPDMLSSSVIDRLITMACDAASPPRAVFPGNLPLRRQGGNIFAGHIKGSQ